MDVDVDVDVNVNLSLHVKLWHKLRVRALHAAVLSHRRRLVVPGSRSRITPIRHQ